MISPVSEPAFGKGSEAVEPVRAEDELSDEALDRQATGAARASYPCALCFGGLPA